MRKVISFILAFCICCLPIISKAVTQSSLQQEQENLKTQIQESNEDLGEVKEELSENLEQVQKLDERINSSKEEIAKLEEQLEQIQGYVDEVQSTLDEEEEKYNEQKGILEKRLVAMYEAGDTEYLDVLLSSKNMSDFLSNYFLVSEMAEYDSLILEEVAEKKDKIEEIKNSLDENKQTQSKTTKILENTKKIRDNYIAQLSESEKEIQAKIDEYNARFEEINKQILELAKGGIDTQYIGGELAWPIPGYTIITSKYGMRTHPITGVYKLHTGCDVGAPAGADFVAANDGIVSKASYNSAYGNMVIIDHGGGISTLYAHGSQILVEEGQYVTRNQPVLKVGSTGYSTGPHAHFEVRINGVVTDPMPYITNGLIPQSQNNNTSNN